MKNSMHKLILITGGARSGKSRYAQKRAEETAGSKCFLATCPPIDPEMDERIINHKKDRLGKGWDTVEEQLDIAGVIKRLEHSVVLVDCLTLWVNNILYSHEIKKEICGEQEIVRRCEQLIEAVTDSDACVILVTNEVGMSIVPDNASARLFRDLVGRCNQVLAAAADEVILVSCGIPLKMK